MRNKIILFFLLIVSVLAFLGSCQSEEQITYARYYVNGKQLYEQHCQNCHSSDGKGLGNLYPPLTDTVFIKKNKDGLACIIKYGMSGPVTVAGKVYDTEMPAESTMPDIEIAALVTYITNSFGNKHGLYDAEAAGNDLKRCLEESKPKQIEVPEAK